MVERSTFDEPEPTRYYTFGVAVSGKTFTVTQTCPSSTTPAQTMPYTAEGSTLTLYILDQGGDFAQVFERQ
jgi:hypothetical protein